MGFPIICPFPQITVPTGAGAQVLSLTGNKHVRATPLKSRDLINWGWLEYSPLLKKPMGDSMGHPLKPMVFGTSHGIKFLVQFFLGSTCCLIFWCRQYLDPKSPEKPRNQRRVTEKLTSCFESRSIPFLVNKNEAWYGLIINSCWKSGGKPRRLVIGRGFGQSTCKGVSAFVSLTAVL